MGAEAHAFLRHAGRRVEGKALLEADELLFRGELRLAIPFKDIRSVTAKDGVLDVRFKSGVAAFEIGARAETWAEKIRNPRLRIDKLGLKPGHRVVVLGVDDPGFQQELAARCPDVTTRLRNAANVIFFAARSERDLARLPALAGYLAPDGAIWTLTPKGKDGINGATVIAAGRAAGLVDVKVVAFSQTHSANKFVIPRARRQA